MAEEGAMQAQGSDFIIIGENIHTTRIVPTRSPRHVGPVDGGPALRYVAAGGEERRLAIPAAAMAAQDYQEGRIKHVKIAVQAAMSDKAADREEGLAYLLHLVRRQEAAGAAFLDLNVDEISLKPAQQQAAMAWLVRAVQQMTRLPLAVDSSNIDIIRVGLEARDPAAARPLLNSASLERIEALDLAREHDARIVVTAAGDRGMPADAAARVANASRMVDAALAKGLAPADIYVDPLIFPISVDKDYGQHSLDAIRALRDAYGPGIHITGGMSNVSFGIPYRKIINDVFLILAMAAGADSGIIDPVTSRPDEVLRLDRGSRAYQLAEDVLLGRDEHCRLFLRAWRKGELKAAVAA